MSANMTRYPAARAIAHPAIRSFGTIGGAVAHGDPNSDYPAALVASDAAIEISSRSGWRSIAAGDFFLDYLTTALEPGEIVSAVIVPAPPSGARGHFLKFARVDGDYATLSVAAILATIACWAWGILSSISEPTRGHSRDEL